MFASITSASSVETRQPPLIVDLDGTLIRSDILVESAFAHLGANPLNIFALVSALWRSRAALKARIASETEMDVAHLPYDEHVLSAIRDARSEGRQVYLASASNERYVGAIARHLGVFDGWFASDGSQNLSASRKARKLVETFGERGFDYIGNDRADLPVWAVARRSVAVGASPKVRRALLRLDPGAVMLDAPSGGARAWLKLLRVHQWAKNSLVFVPFVTAQQFNGGSVTAAVAAFVMFSLAASAIYIVNDLVDLEADRKHPSKRRRPLAAGTVPIISAMALAPFLLAAALAGAVLISPLFAAVLAGYAALTTAYSFSLKRKMMIDVVTLASLYTTRVIGGAAAIGAPVSEWLLAFSMFIFTALALIKRYIELAARLDADLPDPTNRNYRKSDLSVIAALAGASGFNAVTVFALYVSSDTVRHMYHRPQALWLICPVLMYWLGRALMVAHRRQMNDDPIVFALTDRNSLLAFGLIAAIVFIAM